MRFCGGPIGVNFRNNNPLGTQKQPRHPDPDGWFPNALHFCFLNCDFYDSYDSHDKRTRHKKLNTENPGLTTQQFRGNAIFIETSTPQSASYFPAEILSQKSQKSQKSQFRLTMPRMARKIAKLTPMVRCFCWGVSSRKPHLPGLGIQNWTKN